MSSLEGVGQVACDSADFGSAAASPMPSFPRLASSDLLGQSREAVILHRGQEYRLRLTSNDKLILTK